MSDTQYTAVLEVWVQTSSDYNAVKHIRTIDVEPSTTVKEIMEWVSKANVLQAGQVVIVESEKLK